jgi:hypothetical protein
MYHGLYRVVILAAHGYHRTTGNHQLRAWQDDGDSHSRTIPSWSLFNLAEMSEVELIHGRFTACPPGYRLNDSDLILIHCQLLLDSLTTTIERR